MSDATIHQEEDLFMGQAQAREENALATQHVGGEVVQASPATVLEIISRVAADPNIDVARLTSLMDLHERISDRQAEQAYVDAMNACQAEMEPVRKDAHNPQTKSKYATYGALDRALRPIYTRHGFAVSFDTADCPLADHVRVVAEVSHNAGHKKRPHLDMPADGKGAKGGEVMTRTHAVGAALTYGKRYLLGMIFNIAVGDDNDGNSNGGKTRDQGAACQACMASLNEVPGNREALRRWNKANAQMIENLEKWEQDLIIRTFNARWAKAPERA